MRDTRKDKEYFDKYLEYQRSRIEKKMEKLADADEDKRQRILVSLTGYEIDLLKAEFSAGASKIKMKVALTEAIAICQNYKNITYEDLLYLLSLSIILNVENEAKQLIKLHKERIEKDRLLNFLALYIQEKKTIWDKKKTLSAEYVGLDKVIESQTKAELFNYLNDWYGKHSEYSWYNSHLGNSDTYCGYWSFESAAMVTIMRFSEDMLKESDYYPYF